MVPMKRRTLKSLRPPRQPDHPKVYVVLLHPAVAKPGKFGPGIRIAFPRSLAFILV